MGDSLPGRDLTSIEVKVVNEQKIAATFIFNDLFQKPALSMRVESPREVNAQAEVTMLSFLGVLSVCGFLLMVVVLGLIDRSVLSKLSKISRDLTLIEGSGDFKQRIRVLEEDEFASLAKIMNQTFGSLEEAQSSTRRLLDNAGQGFFTFNAQGQVGAQYSKVAEKIWQRRIGGEPIWNLLGDDAAAWSTRLELAFNEVLPFEDSMALYPQHTQVRDREIDLQFKAVYSDHRKLMAVIGISRRSDFFKGFAPIDAFFSMRIAQFGQSIDDKAPNQLHIIGDQNVNFAIKHIFNSSRI